MSGGPVRREKHIKTGGSGLHVNGPAGGSGRGGGGHMLRGGGRTLFGLLVLILPACPDSDCVLHHRQTLRQ